jgi:hypothetical protein
MNECDGGGGGVVVWWHVEMEGVARGLNQTKLRVRIPERRGSMNTRHGNSERMAMVQVA